MRGWTRAIAFLWLESFATLACDLWDSPRRPRVTTTDIALLVADTARVTAADGSHRAWISSDTTIVTVDSTGVLYGVTPGRATVVGTMPYDTIRATVTVDTAVGGWRGVALGHGIWSDGRTYAWRWSAIGVPPQPPALVPGAPVFTKIVYGWSHNCGLTPDGQVYCWFRNDFGQFGDGTTMSSDMPVPVSGGHHFASVAVGEDQIAGGESLVCGRTPRHAIYCWGNGLALPARMPEPQ